MTAATIERLRARAPNAAATFESIGGLVALSLSVAAQSVRRWPGRRAVGEQLEAIGIRSLSVATLTAVFSCMVVAVQFTVQMARFGAQDYVALVVALSQVRELGPVLTALMVGGRVGAGITAELGSMAVSEQIDAMRSMGADPIRQLVVPRVLAATIALPILTAIADLVGIGAAMITAKLESGVDLLRFYHTATRAVTAGDILSGLVKAAFFGCVMSLIACNHGLAARGGTDGVGRATTRTVVVTSVVTLVADLLFTKLLLVFGV
jgi:phospholipid/cholesterol/gamma-HCH transport system permease protein